MDETILLFDSESGCGGHEMRERLPLLACWWAGTKLRIAICDIPGKGVRNVVYVATMHNTVFAFDADSGDELSARWLGNPITGADLHAIKPNSIHTEWGILSTPVIDAATGTLYVVRWGYENGIDGPAFRLFGLDFSNLG